MAFPSTPTFDECLDAVHPLLGGRKAAMAKDVSPQDGKANLHLIYNTKTPPCAAWNFGQRSTLPSCRPKTVIAEGVEHLPLCNPLKLPLEVGQRIRTHSGTTSGAVQCNESTNDHSQ